MEHFIQDILQDLYAIDPLLQKEEKKVRKLIKHMIAIQPETHFSEAYKQELKEKILLQIQHKNEAKKNAKIFLSSLDTFFYKRRFAFGIVAVACFVVLVLPFRNEKPQIGGNGGDYFNTNVLQANDEESFGNIGGIMQKSTMTATAPMAEMSAPQDNIAFKVGADQDIQVFRENIANGFIPNPEVITYNGIFNEYHFPLPEGECNDMFCPLLAGTTINGEKRVQIGLGSNISEADFQRPPTNFVFVIDRSGSMGSATDTYYYDDTDLFDDHRVPCAREETYFKPAQKCIGLPEKKEYTDQYHDMTSKTKMQLAMDALSQMLTKLQPDDTVAIVLFDDIAELAHPVKRVRDIDISKLQEHVHEVFERGSTNMEEGLHMAIDLFEDTSNDTQTQNRIIFLTDAMPNVNEDSPYGLSELVANAVRKNIYFTFLGVGVDFQQQFVQKLSHHQGTNYFFISDARDFKKTLVDEFDYNFFPMVFDLDFSLTDATVIDKIYGTDLADPKAGNILHINTLFPTPPTDAGSKGSIILVKLADDTKDIEAVVSYTTYNGEKKTAKVSLELDNSAIKGITLERASIGFEKNKAIRKAVVLTQYVDTLRDAIQHKTTKRMENIQKVFEQSKGIFGSEDADMVEKEIKTLEKLTTLLQQGTQVKNDYWQE